MVSGEGGGRLTKMECSSIFLLPVFYFANPSYVRKLFSSQPLVSRKRSFLSFEMFHSTIYYYHFVGHCGAFCGLKWRILRAKMYFTPLK